jgi:hypothetical protein
VPSMSDNGTASFQPLSELARIARGIDEQLDNTRELYEHLCAGRERPHLLDDAMLERVLRHVADQVQFLPVYREQLATWYQSQPTAEQYIQLDRVTHQLDQWEALLRQQRDLADGFSAGTIDKMMALSDEELAQGIFSGKIPFPKAADHNRELIAAMRLQLATVLDLKFQEVEETRQGDIAMLAGMRDYLAGFKGLMDSTSRDELNGLMQQFPGLYRLAKLLERIAAGIQSGAIQVPK